MARCKDCGLDMSKAKTCLVDVLTDKDGNLCTRIPYGEAQGDDEKISISANNKCHDCGVQKGGYHHFGCDNEICSNCGKQVFLCGCFSRGHSKKDRKK